MPQSGARITSPGFIAQRLVDARGDGFRRFDRHVVQVQATHHDLLALSFSSTWQSS
jgi:hypothetical protein